MPHHSIRGGDQTGKRCDCRKREQPTSHALVWYILCFADGTETKTWLYIYVLRRAILASLHSVVSFQTREAKRFIKFHSFSFIYFSFFNLTSTECIFPRHHTRNPSALHSFLMHYHLLDYYFVLMQDHQQTVSPSFPATLPTLWMDNRVARQLQLTISQSMQGTCERVAFGKLYMGYDCTCSSCQMVGKYSSVYISESVRFKATQHVSRLCWACCLK